MQYKSLFCLIFTTTTDQQQPATPVVQPPPVQPLYNFEAPDINPQWTPLLSASLSSGISNRGHSVIPPSPIAPMASLNDKIPPPILVSSALDEKHYDITDTAIFAIVYAFGEDPKCISGRHVSQLVHQYTVNYYATKVNPCMFKSIFFSFVLVFLTQHFSFGFFIL